VRTASRCRSDETHGRTLPRRADGTVHQDVRGNRSFTSIEVERDRFLESHYKHLEALGAANKRGLENAETAMTRRGEIRQQTLEEAPPRQRHFSLRERATLPP
jgi:hypothetical protein